MITWIVEHIIAGIPVELWIVVAIGGAVAYTFSGVIAMIPTIHFKVASAVVKYTGLFVTLASVYMMGGTGVAKLWQAQVKEMNDRVVVAEQQSADANTQLEREHGKKMALLEERRVLYKDRIKKEQIVINKDCHLAPEVVGILNDAAQNPAKKAQK